MPHDPILHLLGLAKKRPDGWRSERKPWRGCRGPPGPRLLYGGRRPQYGRRAAHFPARLGAPCGLQVPLHCGSWGSSWDAAPAMLAVTDAPAAGWRVSPPSVSSRGGGKQKFQGRNAQRQRGLAASRAPGRQQAQAGGGREDAPPPAGDRQKAPLKVMIPG